MSEKVRPFHCGSQFADWIDKNCEHCKKAGSCDIQDALGQAYMGDGAVTKEIAERMNHNAEVHYYCWPCNEVESTTTEHAEAVSRWRAQ